MEFIQTEQNSRKLLYHGHLYVKNKTMNNGNTFWECEQRRSGNGSNVKVLFDPGDNFIRISGDHTHAPNSERAQDLNIRAQIRREARLLPDRRTNNIVAGLQSQGRLTKPTAVNCELLLQYDNDNDNRILIFGTASSLDFLQNSAHWFMDGKFRPVPGQFMQLYTVHGLQRGHNVLGAFALLRNKEANTYTEMLNQIHALTNNVEPESFMTDFETGLSNALQRVYPNVPRKGCFFHLCQNIFKHVSTEGLLGRYTDDSNFRMNIKMISALAFVPTNDVIAAFTELSNHCGNDEQVILDYFEMNYIGEQRRGRRLRPRFAHAM
ncbi:uncharacterized protein [Clytia hemisphaerica]|uniref:uncharacterized protein n=1 Tax=Clytia hemisphaerica TaxID=252671 RepID=UPI0034D7270D